jgi:hypothetical protein
VGVTQQASVFINHQNKVVSLDHQQHQVANKKRLVYFQLHRTRNNMARAAAKRQILVYHNNQTLVGSFEMLVNHQRFRLEVFSANKAMQVSLKIGKAEAFRRVKSTKVFYRYFLLSLVKWGSFLVNHNTIIIFIRFFLLRKNNIFTCM